MREKNNAVQRAAAEDSAKIIAKAETERSKKERTEDEARAKTESEADIKEKSENMRKAKEAREKA